MVKRLTRPRTTITKPLVVDEARRKLLGLHLEEVEDKNYIKFSSTPRRPHLIPESDKVGNHYTLPPRLREPRFKINRKKRKSNFLKLFQQRGLDNEIESICSQSTFDFARLKTRQLTFDVALDHLVLNATRFDKASKLKVGQRKLLDPAR